MQTQQLDSYDKITQCIFMHPELKSDDIINSIEMHNLCHDIDSLANDCYFGLLGFESDYDPKEKKLKLTFICELPEANNRLNGRDYFYKVMASANELLVTRENADANDNIKLELFYDL